MKYPSISNSAFRALELKVETVYVEDGNYSPYAIYITRIANGINPKFRVLQKGKDKVKNCIKITYNPDIWERDFLVKHIKGRMHFLNHFSHGSCHRFLNQRTVKDCLFGSADGSGLIKQRLHQFQEQYLRSVTA